MKIKKIAHIGIAVKDIEASSKLYTETFSLNLESTEPVGELLTGFIPIGNTNIELIMSTEPKGTISKFIKNKGEGVHHLALEVEDIEESIKELKEKKVPLTTDKPWKGAHGAKVIFLHPKATNGVLIEICEYPKI